jgi:TolB-like protein/DNA-binding winged helix-turn-helix (wHTH) protein/Tfp pilus assembly protein PilF
LRRSGKVLRNISEKSRKILQGVMSTRPQHLYEFGPYRLDTAEQLLLRDGEPVPLTPKSFETLLALVERSGHLVEKDELMKVVWSDAFVEESNLTNNVYALRKLLGPGENGRSYIETVPKRGYRFTAPVKELSAEALVVEKRTLTRVVTEEAVTDASPRESLIGAGEALAVAHVPSPAALRSKWPWLLITLLAVAMGIGGFYIYRSRTTTPPSPIQSIAVLPFKNESGNPDVEYLSDGVTESLINSLSQLPQLKVIARNSSFEYKGKDVNPQDVSRALGVHAILLGNVIQRDDNLVLSVELIDTRDKTQIWGDRYTRKATDVQALQEEIARTISEKLRLKLTGAQEQQLTKRATQNPQAYQLYLNGLFYRRKNGNEDLRKALEYYKQAVTLDPRFALAFAGMADTHNSLNSRGVVDPKEASAHARTAVEEALELDETLAEAHIELANLKTFEWDWPGAEREYKRAIELNSNLAWAHITYGNYLMAMERHTEALAEIKRAQELDPLGGGRRREAVALLVARRYDEAIEKLRQMIELEPESSFAHAQLAITYAEKGMYAEAIAEAQKVDWNITQDQIYLGYVFAKAGKRREALAILNKLKSTKKYVSPAELAILYAGLGDKEGALALLQRAYDEHDLQLKDLRIGLGYGSLRSDPRFQDLLRRVGLS